MDGTTNRFPRAPEFDSTLALLRDGYRFISNRCDALGSNAFETRLMLRRVICTRGEAAAAMFYHPGRFTRKGAIPPNVVMQLQDFGSVQQQDAAEHRHRKALFLGLLDAKSTARLIDIFRQEWHRRRGQWSRQPRVVLQPEVEAVLFRAAARWAGTPLPDHEAEQRTREIAAMIDGAGSFGPRMLRGLLRRNACERWLRAEIRQRRSEPTGGSMMPAGAIAAYRDLRGHQLGADVAAVELLNLLRPMVAVARWVTFAAVALEQYPQIRERLRQREAGLLMNFVQEVRRFYPFFPLVGGKVREPFEWQGRHFSADDWVMLDLYGTNHDPSVWPHPERFDPDRFSDWNGSAYNFIPQGAGDVERDHRCPGENPTIALLMVAVDELVNGMQYRVPAQDLSFRLDRFPAIPQSRFVMEDVREAGLTRSCSSDRYPARASRSALASENVDPQLRDR